MMEAIVLITVLVIIWIVIIWFLWHRVTVLRGALKNYPLIPPPKKPKSKPAPQGITECWHPNNDATKEPSTIKCDRNCMCANHYYSYCRDIRTRK